MSVFFIAEIGINHNGDLQIAKRMIDMAKECGCDAVKFQKRTIDAVYTPELLASPRESPWGTTQRHQKEGLEFGTAEYDEIDRYCRSIGLPWFASAWDPASQEFLRRYDLPYNKLASAMLTHGEMVNMIAAEGKKTFISTGMSDYTVIDGVVEVFRRNNCPFALLHCVSTYPSDDAECNVRMVATLRERYGCEVGYSGHERGILPSILAVVFGATIIERHITLDRTMYGSDQAASLEKKGIQLVIGYSRDVPAIIGDGVKQVSEKERAVAAKLRYFAPHEE